MFSLEIALRLDDISFWIGKENEINNINPSRQRKATR